MTILVSGGAGYIGSHTVLYLQQQNEEVIVLDNFSKGHRRALHDVKLYEGDLADTVLLDKVFQENKIDAIIHFAASSLVGESMEKPLDYYENNVLSTFQLIKKAVEYKVNNIVFSSTAATYGEPKNIPILETDPTIPTNPYGETKLAIEKMLKWAHEAYELNSICLRYFNAAGADPEGYIGEDHTPESHLIPIVLEAALGQRSDVKIFGDDYPTADGTCIRDYIHVLDLAQAHYLAVQKLINDGGCDIFNLGNGQGFSVKEVIETCRKVTQKEIKADVAPRREGDPAQLIASSERAKNNLGWKPQYDQLETMVQHAWNWHSTHANGFESK
ncbi:UDP-glucose 4-epimerase GalE [Oceanobacillus sp. FSL W8-0428]|uniref:UDP-glucose 4-epimerase GalE n=1 Tax=Oceanobacillus sp. FSL W8-0428 TaxID=2921715 RepID=UPI0030F70845